MPKISGIYKIQSKIKPERIYIGSANNKGRYSEETLEKMRISNQRAWDRRKQKIKEELSCPA